MNSDTTDTREDLFRVFTTPPARSTTRAHTELAAAVLLPPSGQLMALLSTIDTSGLCAADRITYMAGWQACLNWATANTHLAVAAVAGAEPDTSEGFNAQSKPTGDIAEDSICAEIGAALHITALSAKNVMERARAATGPLAPVTERMLGGEWSHLFLWQAERVTAGHSHGLATAAVAAASAGNPNCTAAQFARRIQRELCRLDSVAATDRIRARRQERDAHLEPADDLRGRLVVNGSWDSMAWAHRQFRRWAEERRSRLRANRREGSDADSVSGEERLPTLAELTADAVVEGARLIGARLAATSAGDNVEDSSDKPARGRRWRHAIVVTDLATALGAAEEPGWIPGYGNVPAPIARELLADATHWQRFLLDSAGDLTDIGSNRYRPSDSLREHVTARDQTCTFPYCGRPATDADLDHRENFNGRNTRAENLHPLCRTHHRLKTYANWSPTRAAPDEPTRWRAPSGHQYQHEPESPWPRPLHNGPPPYEFVPQRVNWRDIA